MHPSGAFFLAFFIKSVYGVYKMTPSKEAP